MKVQGQFVHGKWFCSETCANKDPETIQMNELYEKGIDFQNDQVNEEDYSDHDEEIDLWFLVIIERIKGST